MLHRKANWKRFNWDLHNVVGFWLTTFLVLIAVTGAYSAFPQTYRAVISFFAPVTAGKNVPEIAAGIDNQATAVDYIRAAENVVPERRAGRIILPTEANKPVRVFLYEGAIKEYWRVNIVYLAPQTADVLKVERFDERTIGDTVVAWIGVLHFGKFGGVSVKILWLIFGLSLPTLFVTGFVMWWNRIVSKRLRGLNVQKAESKATVSVYARSPH